MIQEKPKCFSCSHTVNSNFWHWAVWGLVITVRQAILQWRPAEDLLSRLTSDTIYPEGDSHSLGLHPIRCPHLGWPSSLSFWPAGCGLASMPYFTGLTFARVAHNLVETISMDMTETSINSLMEQVLREKHGQTGLPSPSPPAIIMRYLEAPWIQCSGTFLEVLLPTHCWLHHWLLGINSPFSSLSFPEIEGGGGHWKSHSSNSDLFFSP